MDGLSERREALLRLIASAERILALTGAGISTECGVPDFRSPGSPWTIHKPIDFQTYLGDESARAEAWRRKFAMDDIYAGAGPGTAHRVLTRLAGEGRLLAVVTQNIDGLHQRAGLPADLLVELHGNGTYARCLDCDRVHDLAPIRARFESSGVLPVCACGGIVKSGSIAFGQGLRRADVTRAIEAAAGCDLCLVLGSSLLVQPAARLPALAKQAGAALAIINRTPTLMDRIFDQVLHDEVQSALHPLDR